MVQTEVLGVGTVLGIEILNGPPVEDLQLAVGQGAVSGGCYGFPIGGLDLLVGDGVAALAGHIVRVAVGGNGCLGGFGSFRALGGLGGRLRGQGLRLYSRVLAVQNQHGQNGGQQQDNGCAKGNGRGAGNALLHRGGFRCALGICRRGRLGSVLRSLNRDGHLGSGLLGGIRRSFRFPGHRDVLRLLFSTSGADGQFLVKFLAAIMALFHGFLFSPMFGMIILPSLPCLLEKCK